MLQFVVKTLMPLSKLFKRGCETQGQASQIVVPSLDEAKMILRELRRG